MKDRTPFEAAPEYVRAAFLFLRDPTKKPRFRGRLVVLPLLFFLLFLSCSGRYPRIHDIRYEIVGLQGAEERGSRETLSLALDVTDEDGLEDLETVALVLDAEQLYWKIERSQWEWKSFGGGKWLVCSGILPEPGHLFPRGEYRVLVADLAGYRAEATFRLQDEPVEGAFPSIERKGGTLVLHPGEGPVLLVLTSSTGAVLGSFPLKPGANPIDPILASPAIRTQAKEFYLYSRSSSGEGPIRVKGPYAGSEFLFSREETEHPVENVQ
ncbi:MAG: hypothetical protein Kow009_09350 [Spirochaetales bacterium]